MFKGLEWLMYKEQLSKLELFNLEKTEFLPCLSGVYMKKP